MGRFLLPCGNGRLRAAQIVGNAKLGGVVSSILNYYSHIDRTRWRFDFFTYGPSSLDEKLKELDSEARVVYIPRLDTQFYKAVPQLAKQLKSGEYAVAHSHMTTLSVFALRAAKKAGIPVRICHAHSTFDRTSDHFLVKSILRPFAARDATVLAACGELAAQNLYGKRADKAIVLKNAIDLEKFSPASLQEREKLREQLRLHGRILLFVGRFEYQKNLLFLLDAFALAAKRTPSLQLVLMGDGSQKQALLDRASELDLSTRIRFFGPGDPLPLYRAADVFVLPSRYEGMPVVAAEAQATGLPCLFSDRVSREADIAGGSLFLPLNEEEWAKQMEMPRKRRTGSTEKLREAGYDIRLQALQLTQLYERELKKI